MISKIIVSDYSKTTILIRLMVGTVFFSEGTQKLLFPAIRGAGRFEMDKRVVSLVKELGQPFSRR